MEITPTAQTAAAAAKTAAAAGEAETATGAAATDFQTFLTLLTTQLRNQDPLKPMESTEFVAQLASFSGVEQQIRTNDRLGDIFEALGGGASAGLADWIGKEVRAPAKGAFAGVPVEIATTPDPEADRAVLTVTNDFGQIVARRAVEPGARTIAWDGTDELGQGLPHGLYAFAVERYRGEELLGSAPGEVFGVVREVRLEDGAPSLILEGGGSVAVADVTALR
jgi:flagellar basal-body rod modification protein FlgD